MSKREKGVCCICGQYTDLTFEHIPPKAAFNHFNLKLYDFYNYFINNDTRYIPAQRGVGEYSLCPNCNNNTGKWYGSAYAAFAYQGRKYQIGKSQGTIGVPYTIYPLRVFKQVISCFASVNGPLWCQKHPSIRSFLLDPYSHSFPSEIDIRMYMQDTNRVKINSILAQINTQTREHFLGSEWGYPPFSFIAVEDKNYTNDHILNELYSVSRFLQYGYNDLTTLYLKIPRRPCNPNILDFRKNIPDIETLLQSESNK